MDNEQIQPLYQLTTNQEPTTELSRDYVALECMLRMLTNPSIMNQSFDVVADFSYRQADAFLAKSKEPQI